MLDLSICIAIFGVCDSSMNFADFIFLSLYTLIRSSNFIYGINFQGID
jgi:uncharacterized membrane protein YbaN (DUF454 family)